MSGKHFKKVSEWVNAGCFDSGYYVFDASHVTGEETNKAIEFKAERFTSAGNPYTGTSWLPKSQVLVLFDDFYESTKGQKAYAIPGWLVSKKIDQCENLLNVM